jgi:hypothetical protein
MRIAEQTSPTRPLIAGCYPHQQQFLPLPSSSAQITSVPAPLPAAVASTVAERRSPTSLALRDLLQRRDIVGLSVEHWYTYSSTSVVLDLRAGPSFVRSWSKEGKVVHSTVPWREGNRSIMTMETRWFLKKRFSLTITFALSEPKMSLGLNFSFAVHNVLQPSDPAHVACRDGDWLTLRRLLEEKRANIFDVTEFGDSLLHVCIARPVQT